jgi:hypothetical protein
MLHTITDGGTWYQYSGGQEPAGASICQIHYLGDLWTVRDSGALDLYGNGICTNLTKLVNGVPLATAVPVPTIKVPPLQVYAICGLRVAGHDATVVMDVDECAAFERDYPPADGSWEIYSGSAAPAGDQLVCQGSWKGDGNEWGQAQIWDSGGQYYATDLCKRLGWTR